MSEQNIVEENENERPNVDIERVDSEIDETRASNPQKMFAWILTAVIVGLIAIVGLIWIVSKRSAPDPEAETAEVAVNADAKAPTEVKLEPETVAAANLEYEGVTQRPAIALLRVTGTVESNQQETQQVTPLVSGRVERVNVAVGDRVSSGTPVAVVSSPEVAELRGKLHDAVTRLEIAQRNFTRVQRSENRVAVMQAKAKLDEADATLKRTRRLIELGAGAGKDLISAETRYTSAKADYDFQNNISLNREIQEARAMVDTTRVDVTHVRDQLRALGAAVSNSNAPDDHSRNTSLITLYAPVSGMVTERMVNAGAGIEAAKPLFTIANISTVWVVASVPEMQIGLVRPGTRAEVSSASLGDGSIDGQVSYVDPQLNEETRTARVRIVVANPGERLKVGMFAQIGFQTSTDSSTGEELVVPATAIQRIGTKSIVFLAKQGENGTFEVREVETGGDIEGYTRILSGLKLGEMVVTKGSFILKTQLEKGAM